MKGIKLRGSQCCVVDCMILRRGIHLPLPEHSSQAPENEDIGDAVINCKRNGVWMRLRNKTGQMVPLVMYSLRSIYTKIKSITTNLERFAIFHLDLLIWVSTPVPWSPADHVIIVT